MVLGVVVIAVDFAEVDVGRPPVLNDSKSIQNL